MLVDYKLGVSVYQDKVVSPYIFFASKKSDGINLPAELNIVIPIFYAGLSKFISLIADIALNEKDEELEYNTNLAQVLITAHECKIINQFDQSNVTLATSLLIDILRSKQKFIEGWTTPVLFETLGEALSIIKSERKKDEANWYSTILDGYQFRFLLSEGELDHLDIDSYLKELFIDDRYFSWKHK